MKTNRSENLNFDVVLGHHYAMTKKTLIIAGIDTDAHKLHHKVDQQFSNYPIRATI
jgi:hypothetical protein